MCFLYVTYWNLSCLFVAFVFLVSLFVGCYFEKFGYMLCLCFQEVQVALFALCVCALGTAAGCFLCLLPHYPIPRITLVLLLYSQSIAETNLCNRCVSKTVLEEAICLQSPTSPFTYIDEQAICRSTEYLGCAT